MRWLLVALLLLATSHADAARQRSTGEELIRVVAPTVDRVRFGAADATNQAPVITLAADQDVVAIGVPVGFDASGSHDPDFDELRYQWSFSDGETATGATVSHAFAAADGEATAT